MPGRLLLVAAALLLLAACGSVGPGAQPSPPTAALAAWENFPANQVPRPIVLLGTYSPGQGFDSGDVKVAEMCGKVAPSISMPSGVPDLATATWADGTTLKSPAISAADALAALKRLSDGSQSMCSNVAPLSVTAVRFGVAGFQTDRGTAQMSAWLFKATGARAELISPAFPRSAFWGNGITTRSGNGGATVSVDGRSLTFFFTGSREGTGPCESMYRGMVSESGTAIAIAPEPIPHEQAGGGGACTLVGYRRSVTVSLASPLGGRVVVDARGSAVPVCPEAARAGC